MPERSGDYMIRATGLYPQDVDTVQDMAAARKTVESDPEVALVLESVTGSGLCVCVRGPITHNAKEYSAVYEKIAAAKSAQWKLSGKLDTQTKDCNRLRFLSYDPDIYVNWDAKVFEVPRAESKPVDESQSTPAKERGDADQSDKSQKADPKDLDDAALAARRKTAEDMLAGVDWQNDTHGFQTS